MPFVHIFDIMCLFAAELEEPKFGVWGKGLNGILATMIEILFIISLIVAQIQFNLILRC